MIASDEIELKYFNSRISQASGNNKTQIFTPYVYKEGLSFILLKDKEKYLNLKSIISSFDSINDDYYNETPSEVAIHNAIISLNFFSISQILPKVLPTADGSILFEFEDKNLTYLVEYFNNGDIALLKRNINSLEAFDFTLPELKSYIFDLGDFSNV